MRCLVHEITIALSKKLISNIPFMQYDLIVIRETEEARRKRENYKSLRAFFCFLWMKEKHQQAARHKNITFSIKKEGKISLNFFSFMLFHVSNINIRPHPLSTRCFSRFVLVFISNASFKLLMFMDWMESREASFGFDKNIKKQRKNVYVIMLRKTSGRQQDGIVRGLGGGLLMMSWCSL